MWKRLGRVGVYAEPCMGNGVDVDELPVRSCAAEKYAAT